MERFAFAALALLAVDPVLGAGFYSTEVGSPGSLGTAGVANPTNDWGADTVWTNPAGMTGVDRRVMVNGAPHPHEDGNWVVLTGFSGEVRIHVTAGSV